MPPQLREWPAYHELKKEIEDFQHILPILMELSKKSISDVEQLKAFAMVLHVAVLLCFQLFILTLDVSILESFNM